MVAVASVLAVVLGAPPIDLAKCVPLRVCGLGRYASSPALFLEDPRGDGGVGGNVLPVPIPADAVRACEQAMAPQKPAMMEVLMQTKAIGSRDALLFDNLPWQWSPSPQAKQNAFARFSGRGYPAEGYRSPYHLVVDMMRRDACADPSHVVLENTAILGGLVLGGAVLLERRLPVAVDSGATRAMGSGPDAAEDARWWASADDDAGGDDSVSEEAVLCECAADEALGVALALGRGTVYVERAVWDACQLAPQYSTQRGKMRLDVAPRASREAEEEKGAEVEADGRGGRGRPPPPLPWEIASADELLSLSREERALSALRAGVRLPRAREATDGALLDLLAPLLDEKVRRELAIRQALEAGDETLAASLDAATSRRGQLAAALRRAVQEERFGEAARLSNELRVETSRRMDVTRDEGSYDRYLDQDDWYAQGLERERQRELQRDRERAAQRERERAAEADKARAAAEAAEANEEALKAEEEAARAEEEATKEAAKAAAAAASVDEAASAGAAFRFDTRATQAAGAATTRDDTTATSATRRAAAVEADTWTDELATAVGRQMIAAFDNYPREETERLLGALVAAATRGDREAEVALQKLATATRQMEALEDAAARGRGAPELLEDEARALRSQIRMWGKDGERYMRAEEGGGDPWLSWLDGLRRGL